MKDLPITGTPTQAPVVTPSPSSTGTHTPATTQQVPTAAQSKDIHASTNVGEKYTGAVTMSIPTPSATMEINPTQPTKFAGNPRAAEALMIHAPQKNGVECGGYAIAYTLLHSGATRSKAQRQADVDATLSLAKAMDYQPSASEKAALAAYANGSMTAGQVQHMGEMYYIMARGTLASSAQTGFSPAQMTRMVTNLAAFGAFQGVQADIRLHTLPPNGAHFTMRHAATTGNSMPNGAGKASVQGDLHAGLPNDAKLVATISINGQAASATIEMERASDGKSGTITPSPLPAAQRTRESFLKVDNSALKALNDAGVDRT